MTIRAATLQFLFLSPVEGTSMHVNHHNHQVSLKESTDPEGQIEGQIEECDSKEKFQLTSGQTCKCGQSICTYERGHNACEPTTKTGRLLNKKKGKCRKNCDLKFSERKENNWSCKCGNATCRVGSNTCVTKTVDKLLSRFKKDKKKITGQCRKDFYIKWICSNSDCKQNVDGLLKVLHCNKEYKEIHIETFVDGAETFRGETSKQQMLEYVTALGEEHMLSGRSEEKKCLHDINEIKVATNFILPNEAIYHGIVAPETNLRVVDTSLYENCKKVEINHESVKDIISKMNELFELLRLQKNKDAVNEIPAISS